MTQPRLGTTPTNAEPALDGRASRARDERTDLATIGDTKIESPVVIPSTLTPEGGLTAAEDTKIESWVNGAPWPSQLMDNVPEWMVCPLRLTTEAKIESPVVIPSTLTPEGGLTAAEDTKIESWVNGAPWPSQLMDNVPEWMVCPLRLTTEAKIESPVVIPLTLTAEGGRPAAEDSGRNQFSNLQRNIENSEN
ncbi:hypothetical protein B0H12DRAFT_1074084 [Mycena haematopus]|nr:hypothetical protein B0H12DRAFT_1074084 [Mycena haematopus]